MVRYVLEPGQTAEDEAVGDRILTGVGLFHSGNILLLSWPRFFWLSVSMAAHNQACEWSQGWPSVLNLCLWAFLRIPPALA